MNMNTSMTQAMIEIQFTRMTLNIQNNSFLCIDFIHIFSYTLDLPIRLPVYSQ